MKKKDIIPKKDSGFKVPNGYFNNMEERVFEKIDLEKLKFLKKEESFKVPTNYFKDFESRLSQQIHGKKTVKVRHLINYRYAAYIGGIAAAILLVFHLVINPKSTTNFDDLHTSTIQTYIIDENFNSYELAQALDMENMALSNTSHDIVSDKEIEQYLLENTTIEELIIE